LGLGLAVMGILVSAAAWIAPPFRFERLPATRDMLS
jgi:hypothetical protein